MSADGGAEAFAERLLESSSSELRQMAAAGLAPQPLPKLLALQVELTRDTEAPIAEAARKSLAVSPFPRIERCGASSAKLANSTKSTEGRSLLMLSGR